jgi:hypothetical protein
MLQLSTKKKIFEIQVLVDNSYASIRSAREISKDLYCLVEFFQKSNCDDWIVYNFISFTSSDVRATNYLGGWDIARTPKPPFNSKC